MRVFKNKETGVVFISNYHDHYNCYYMTDIGLVRMDDDRFEILDIPARIAKETLPVFK